MAAPKHTGEASSCAPVARPPALKSVEVSKSFSLAFSNLMHSLLVYVPYLMFPSLVYAASYFLPEGVDIKSFARDLTTEKCLSILSAAGSEVVGHLSVVWPALLIISVCIYFLVRKDRPVYLVDFEVFDAPKDWNLSHKDVLVLMRAHGCFTEETLSFIERLLAKSGTSQHTSWPPGTVRMVRNEFTPAVFVPKSKYALTNEQLEAEDAKAAAEDLKSLEGSEKPRKKRAASVSTTATYNKIMEANRVSRAEKNLPEPQLYGLNVKEGQTPPDRSIAAAVSVAELVLCTTFENLLLKTKTHPRDIDFLIVNCSLLCPTPSLASLVARRFQMSPTLRSYNLGGMGCSAGVIATDLARQLLQTKPNARAVVLSTEEISQCLYLGNERHMLLQNTLFRVGGSAILLSNRASDGLSAKFKLLHTTRTQVNTQQALDAVIQCEDAAGQRGISLSKELTTVAGTALKDNFTLLAPHVLPVSELLKVGLSMAARAVAPIFGLSKPALYNPDFRRAFQHFCIHAGGRAVIDGIEKNLKLSREQTAPSRATLFHYGNTSSSSIWYEMSYVEGERDENRHLPPPEDGEGPVSEDNIPVRWTSGDKWNLPEYRGRHVQAGERVVQIAFGSGFKCNSAVWLRLK